MFFLLLNTFFLSDWLMILKRKPKRNVKNLCDFLLLLLLVVFNHLSLTNYLRKKKKDERKCHKGKRKPSTNFVGSEVKKSPRNLCMRILRKMKKRSHKMKHTQTHQRQPVSDWVTDQQSWNQNSYELFFFLRILISFFDTCSAFAESKLKNFRSRRNFPGCNAINKPHNSSYKLRFPLIQ